MTDVDNQMAWRERIEVVLRWLIMLPTAIVGSYLAYFVISLIIRCGLSPFSIYPLDSTFSKIVLGSQESLAISVSFVFICVKMAPGYKISVAVGATSLILLLSGAIILAAILSKNYISLISCAFLILGAVGAASAIVKQESGE